MSHKLELACSITGYTAAEFDDAKQLAFRKAMASTIPSLTHSWRAVLITQIRDIPANKRRRVLQQSGGRIEVVYEILCEDQATADLVLESATSDLTAALHAEGLTNVTSAETTVLVGLSPPPSSDSGVDVTIVAGAAAGGAAFVLAIVAVCWLRSKRTGVKVMMNPAVRRRNRPPVVVVMAPS
jgi:hypothetical protein